MQLTVLLTLALPLQISAHFALTYPVWRADSLSASNASISQWTYPCANVQTMQNASQPRTPWPINGGSVSLQLHHHWTYLFINLGFGNDVTNFNVSLNPDGGKLLNETGNGTLCYDKLKVPSTDVLGLQITEGMYGSIQVVTVGDKGSALYNCADIVFTSNATLLPSNECMNSTGVSVQSIQTLSNSTASGNSPGGPNSTTANSTSNQSGSSKSALMTTPFLLAIPFAGIVGLW